MAVPSPDPADFDDLLCRVAAEVKKHGDDWADVLAALPEPVLRRIAAEFFLWQAHGGQREPDGSWRCWLLMAGRGFGKTLAGAHWVAARARAHPGCAIALVGGGRDEVVKVMIEGPSGLIATARAGEPVTWAPTRGELRFASGATGFVYSAAAPEKLRGPEHHFAWADELAKWPEAKGSARGKGENAWDNLMMGLRQGEWPRCIVTTTPRSNALVRRVKGAARTVTTEGRTAQNVHLAAGVRAWLEETYGGTRLGRQELDGMLFGEAEGALISREVLEAARTAPHPNPLPQAGEGAFRRIVVGVDPPVSAGGDACGIVVCGLGAEGRAYVLEDASVAGLSPEGWAQAVAAAAERWGADRVVAEANQGGDMVASVLRQASLGLPVKLVHASRGKVRRAEPVAAAFENGRVKLAGRFPALEDELAGLTIGGGYEAEGLAGRSPDRADACIWALTELLRPRAEPQVVGL
ncbi:phage terminase large subunit family protein [Sphingosinicella sp.]|uniref:phage terminase large subunit family protein n=1 Tax=Sphingosinicella sp. TaxID=1917971 RepID=UPI0040379692